MAMRCARSPCTEGSSGLCQGTSAQSRVPARAERSGRPSDKQRDRFSTSATCGPNRHISIASKAIVIMVEAAGARSFLAVPMLKDARLSARSLSIAERFGLSPTADRVVGQFRRPGRYRHRERAAARRAAPEIGCWQTATVEVLQVISSFSRRARHRYSSSRWRMRHASATPISARCYLSEDDAFRAAAIHNAPPASGSRPGAEPIGDPSPKITIAARGQNETPLQCPTTQRPGWPRDEPQFALFAGLRRRADRCRCADAQR